MWIILKIRSDAIGFAGGVGDGTEHGTGSFFPGARLLSAAI
jgi:hypothetical protein